MAASAIQVGVLVALAAEAGGPVLFFPQSNTRKNTIELIINYLCYYLLNENPDIYWKEIGIFLGGEKKKINKWISLCIFRIS